MREELRMRTVWNYGTAGQSWREEDRHDASRVSGGRHARGQHLEDGSLLVTSRALDLRHSEDAGNHAAPPSEPDEYALASLNGCQHTKTCPRCGAELFIDMDVCYECLYDFSREKSRSSEASAAGGMDEPGRPVVWNQGTCPFALELSADQTIGLPEDGPGAKTPKVPSLRIRCADMDVTIPLGPGGLLVGRSPDCDVVLHSVAVSRRHVRFRYRGKLADIEDLGATNPAMLRGREVTGTQPVAVGETVDVCGVLFTFLAPAL